MKLLTSINPSPTRLARQIKCVESWMKYGYDVIALQPYNQVRAVMDVFQDITVIGTDKVGTSISKPNLVEIHTHLSLCKEYNEPMILINSDIELLFSIADFDSYWCKIDSNVFKIGIRWNHNAEQANLCPYGIDVFQLTPVMADQLPNHGFVIGCPTWDYWIIYHLHSLGYSIHANKELRMLHEVHDERWSRTDYEITCNMFNRNYPIDHKQLSTFISKVTGREHYIKSMDKRRGILK